MLSELNMSRFLTHSTYIGVKKSKRLQVFGLKIVTLQNKSCICKK